jgi:hypothetical protein
MPVPLSHSDPRGASRRIRPATWSLRPSTAVMHTPALVSEATARKLLEATREALAQSYELLEQVGRGREFTAREAEGILERLHRQEAGRLPPRAGQDNR